MRDRTGLGLTRPARVHKASGRRDIVDDSTGYIDATHDPRQQIFQ